jgi:hypothetical protein
MITGCSMIWKRQSTISSFLFRSKQLKGGESKIRKVLEISTILRGVYNKPDRLIEAKTVLEEAYMYASEIHHPDHPLTLQAAGSLIEVYGRTGDHERAELIARQCYQVRVRIDINVTIISIFPLTLTLNLNSNSNPEIYLLSIIQSY